MFLQVQLQEIKTKTNPIQMRNSVSSVQEYCLIFVSERNWQAASR